MKAEKPKFKKDGTCKYGCHVCPSCNESLKQQALSELRDEIKKISQDNGAYIRAYRKKILELLEEK